MREYDSDDDGTCLENDGSLAYRLEDYMMSGSFLMELNNFVKQHAKKFTDVNGKEHLHEWYELFRQYSCLVSARLDVFLSAEHVSAEQAIAECRLAKAGGNENYKYFEYVAAALEYESFHQMMLDFKAGKRDVSEWWAILSHYRA